MTTNLHYDFFRPNLWERRLDSIDDAAETTFQLFDTLIATVEGFSAEKFAHLLRDAGGGDYSGLIQQLGDAPSAEQVAEVADQIAADFGKRLGHLSEKLARHLQAGRLPLSAPHSYAWSDFEIRQLINLYTLSFTIYNTFWNDRSQEIKRELQRDAAFPSIHLLRRYFRHIGNDLEIVQRALVQRSGRRLQARALQVTDKLAFMALSPFQHLLPDADQINPITYFSQHTHCHHIPYHPDFVLIGLKYDALPPHVSRRAYGEQKLDELPPLPTFELMMIPHEVAHYVYHYGIADGGMTIKQWAESQFNHPWQEEIFADVYGSIISGPLMALGLQALIAYTDEDAICSNDGEHPTAIVRPLLVGEILRVLNDIWEDRYPFAQIAQKLDENWLAILQRQGHRVKGEGVIYPARGEAPIEIAEMLRQFRPMIESFIHFLFGSADVARWRSSQLPWTTAVPDHLQEYDAVMAHLTSRDIAYRDVPQTLVDHKHVSHATLQQILQNWFDDGPLGIGGHGLNATQEADLRKRYERSHTLTAADVKAVVGASYMGTAITTQVAENLVRQLRQGS